MSDVSDETLLLMIDEADRALHAQGLHLSARRFRCVVEVCRKLGHVYSIGVNEDPLVKHLRELALNFFRPKDGAAPSIFTGMMTHLGFAYQVNVPMIFGSVGLDPFAHTDATSWQLKRIYRVRDEFEVCFRQVCDVWDIATQLAPFDGKQQLSGRVADFFDLASFHLTAAASTVSQRTANRGAAQSALVSTELAIKSMHLQNGRSEDWIKKNISHDLTKNIDEVQEKFGGDYASVMEAIQKLPPLVAERYGDVEIQATKMVDLVVISQSILGAVARSFCGYGCRQKFQTRWT